MIILPPKYSNIMETHLEGPADIVIEILSPATRELDLTKKVPTFLAAGVQEVWVIDPEHQAIFLHSQEETVEWTDPATPEFLHSKVLPNLPFRINWIWQRDKYPLNEIVKEILETSQQ